MRLRDQQIFSALVQGYLIYKEQHEKLNGTICESANPPITLDEWLQESLKDRSQEATLLMNGKNTIGKCLENEKPNENN